MPLKPKPNHMYCKTNITVFFMNKRQFNGSKMPTKHCAIRDADYGFDFNSRRGHNATSGFLRAI